MVRNALLVGRRAVTVVAGIGLVAPLLAGCTSGAARLPRLTALDPSEGFKMLRPEATARECAGAWGLGGGGDSLADAALRRLLSLDDEADAVLNARLEWTTWTFGVYERRCVSLTGDVVRSIRTVLLPMPDHGGMHTGHEGH